MGAEIMSVQEELLLDTFLIEGTTYWLALTDLAHEGTYRWQESHSVADYVNWAPNEPSGSTDTNCIWKTYYPAYTGWHDAGCSSSSYDGYGQEMHALCETAK